MDTTITQKPSEISPAYTPLVYVLEESASGTYNGFKFRYVLIIEIDGTEVAILKIHKNGSNVGIFDISRVVSTYTETQLYNNNSKSNKLHDQIFWYKADNHKNFKLGSKEFWEISKTMDSDDDEEVYDPNTRDKKKGPKINVRKSKW